MNHDWSIVHSFAQVIWECKNCQTTLGLSSGQTPDLLSEESLAVFSIPKTCEEAIAVDEELEEFSVIADVMDS